MIVNTRNLELLYILTCADLKVKYQNAWLGFVWSLLNPLLLVTVLYLVFHNFRHLEENFVLYLLTGIISWRFFTQTTNAALHVLVAKSGIIINLPIPRHFFVIVKVLSNLVSSLLEFSVLIPVIGLITGGVSVYAIFFPLIHILFVILLYGTGIILAGLYPYFRDLSEIWAVVIQLGFFLSPIVYPISYIPEDILPFYLLNPVTQLILMYQGLIISGRLPEITAILYVAGFGIVLTIVGTFLFRRLNRRFAEVI